MLCLLPVPPKIQGNKFRSRLHASFSTMGYGLRIFRNIWEDVYKRKNWVLGELETIPKWFSFQVGILRTSLNNERKRLAVRDRGFKVTEPALQWRIKKDLVIKRFFKVFFFGKKNCWSRCFSDQVPCDSIGNYPIIVLYRP